VLRGEFFFAVGIWTGYRFLLVRVNRTPAPPSNDAEPSSINTIPAISKTRRILWRIEGSQFLGTGITAYLENGGTLEKARQMAAHSSTRTTQLYDRREDRVTLDEVVKINIRG